jgi:hypothetical protein
MGGLLLMAGLLIFAVVPIAAQDRSSLTNSGLETSAGAGLVPVGDIAALQESILLLRATVQELSQSLAIANSEAEMFKRHAADLALQLDTLGFADLESNPERLESRLLTAVRELRRSQSENEAMRAQMLILVESVVALLGQVDSLEPVFRVDIEKSLRQANEFLGEHSTPEAPAVEASLTDAMIVDVKNDLSLVVVNVGSRQNVQLGMRFTVLRGQRPVGTILVIDVRDRISGGIIQNLVSEDQPIQVGDRLRVETRF